MTAQKGVAAVLENRAFFEREEVKLILLGAGDPKLEAAVRELAVALPGKVAAAQRLDEKMSHLVEAGSDFFLMPSQFEPCGLNQMYSQAYGTVPVVSRVGGLVDTVVDIEFDPARGTGIMVPPTSEGLRGGLKRALALWGRPKDLAGVRRRGMTQDFSWARAAEGYAALYEECV